jgi:transposase
MKILAIDLGKFDSVACLFDTLTHQSEFETVTTQPSTLEQLLAKTQPEQVVIETSSISGWVHDLCQRLDFKIIVANPSQEAWQWKNVKRKTDKDDALKLGLSQKFFQTLFLEFIICTLTLLVASLRFFATDPHNRQVRLVR